MFTATLFTMAPNWKQPDDYQWNELCSNENDHTYHMVNSQHVNFTMLSKKKSDTMEFM